MYLIKKLNVVCTAALLFVCFACNDEFLERKPLTQLVAKDFFKTEQDLKFYVNSFYAYLPNHTGWNPGLFNGDSNSDNAIWSTSYNTMLNGERVVPASGGGYSWTNIRNVNYFFDKIGDFAKSTDSNVKQYIGEACFFRAWLYFGLLKQFGDLPWIDKVLPPKEDALALERISRKTIAENIIKDLDKAIANMSNGTVGASNRVNKHVALALKARVCLYEGTWEKYHSGTVFGVSGSDGTTFIEKARDAAKLVIDSKIYDLYKGATPGKIEGDEYYSLFNKTDYSGNKEVLFWAGNSTEQGMTHNMNRYISPGNGPQLTKSMVDSYLKKDGTEPTKAEKEAVGLYTPTGKPSYIKMHRLIENRDPRLMQSVIHIGEKVVSNWPDGRPDTTLPHLWLDSGGNVTGRTGFPIKKGKNENYEQISGGNVGTVGAIIFRYAEILLIYAEAQAELGKNAEAMAAIDKLRERVGMAKLSAVMPAGSNVLSEVRRERRVELLCEGFRLDDLFRWKEMRLIKGWRPKGIKYQGNADLEQYYSGTFKPIIDVTGKKGNNALPKLEINKGGFFVDSNGFIDPYKNGLTNGYQFDENKDYLAPINQRDINLSKGKLKQNPGWKND